MQALFKAIAVLPGWDWAALAVFFCGWVGYARFAKRRAHTQPSVLASTNRIRHLWMLQSTRREVRVLDAIVMQSLATSPSFFASTTILIIGGLLAALSATDRASEMVREIPFTAQTSLLVFDLKLLLLLAIFVYGFFRFTWSMRQYTFGAMLIATAPEMAQFDVQGSAAEMQRNAFADRAGRVVSLAAETFNDGLRGYYFAFAAIGWFFSPFVFVLATAGIIFILYRREFKSEVLTALNS
jgi:uncharacterized membrane protein